jgi:glycosyltransferase involved in cell wall biosynthesis/SAM-dependent methyltransferase
MTHPAPDANRGGSSEPPPRPRVSVVMPFWNAGVFLEEAISSVIVQTMSSWELLLIDDGSSDGSTEIAQRYADCSPASIRYLAHDGRANRGVAASRNLGVRHARAPYIAFLDADDVWFPNKLARQTAILDSEPEAAMVCGPSLFWYGWTGRPEDAERDYVKDLRIAPAGLVKAPTLLLSSLTRGTFVANPSTIVIRREALDRTGGFEESFVGAVQTFEDDAFLAKVQLRESVFVATECWSKYRRHENSLLSIMTATGKTRAARLFYLIWLEDYLTEQRVESHEIWEALRLAQWPYRHPGRAAFRNALGLLSIRNAKDLVKRAARRTLPSPVHRWLRARRERHRARPAPAAVDFGGLRRVTPVGRLLGRDRGLPIDRYYIERFLTANADRIRGHVLELDDDRYTRAFGGDRVTRSDVLHVNPTNPRATIVADLTSAEEQIPSQRFDTIILTQALPFIYDVHAVVRTLHRILRPGGAVLATVGGIAPISRRDMERWGHYWSFTTLSARLLFEEAFPPAGVRVEASGNVLAATAFLHGLAAEELSPSELDHRDPDYEFLITIVAVKDPLPPDPSRPLP